MTPVRFIFSLLLSVCIVLPCWSQISSNPWSFPKNKQILTTTKDFPQQHTLVQLKEEVLVSILSQAPLRFSEAAKKNKVLLTLPLAGGTLAEFSIVEAPVLHPDLGKKYPNIRSFAGQSISDPTTTVRFSWSPKGFQGLVLAGGETSIIDSYSSSNTVNHVVYNRKNRAASSSAFECSIRRHEGRSAVTAHSRSQQARDCQLRTYRLALACTGEYTSYHGGSTADALAGMNASITRINGVFENELAVSFQIIPQNINIIFLNPGTDPYSNFDGVEMLDENQETIDQIVGASNYDVGHVFSTGGGGIAGLGVVCSFRSKAEGVTGSPQPEGDLFDIDFVAHELGHQFGAEHTFNGNREACSGNAWGPSAVEPGGGSTIMAYAGICGSQNIQSQSDVYFHAQSIDEISRFITSDGDGCAQITDLINDGPIADAGQDYIIPISTPFVLSGVRSDSNEGAHTFNWEQMDTEFNIQPPLSTNSSGPLFRSNPPITSVDRFFPDLRFLARNLDNRWEVLPSVARELNFRFTVRDNNIGGGCTGEDDMNIIVNDQAGPFLVLVPNTNVSWIGGAKEIITWDVANTSAGPINAAAVDILLSVDGGLSFTQTVLTNTPNTGAAEITVPNIATNAARIMVRASENIFFDISDRNFIIEPIRDDFLVFVEEATQEACIESSVSYQVNVDVSGTLNGTVALSARGLPNGITVAFSDNNFIPPSDITLTLTPDANTAPGIYNFEVDVTGTTGTQSRNLSLTIINATAELILDSPINNSKAVEPAATFGWNVLQGAEKYTLRIATDAAFSNPLTFSDIDINIFSIPVSLSTNTRYYWKVIAEGPCLINKESETFTFLTSNVSCKIYDSEDIPIEISNVGSPTIISTINIPDEGIVTDVNVLNLQIDHSFVSDIAVGLTSPSEDLAILLLFPCLFEENVDINFDDDDANSFDNIPCPPVGGGRYNSLDELSVFDGSPVNGDWVLIVNDDANDDGGSLNTWSLEVCFLQEASVVALSVNAAKTDETCFGINDGTASVDVLDGTGNYTFIWSNGATDSIITQLSPGTYTVTVSDGVTDIVESMTIAAGSEIDRSFEIVNQSCDGGVEDGQITALSIEGTELDYNWPDGSNGATFSNLKSGTYEVVITETTTGCTASEVLEVSAPDPIFIVTEGRDVSCANGSDAFIQPVITGGFPPYTIAPNDLVNIPAGNYTVQVTDANNCVQTSMVTVTEPSPIIIDFSASPISRIGAMDGLITAMVNGGNGPYTYDWSNASNEASINGLAEGTYEVIVTDQNGCSKTASTIVAGIECSAISIMLSTEQISTVNGADGRITASIINEQGSYTYLWSTGATTAIVSDLSVGTFSVTVTDEKGCTGTQTSVINEIECTPLSIMFNIEQISELDGTDGRITATIDNEEGPYTYLWSTGATAAIISDLSVGTYSLTVTDERGCTSAQTGVINRVDCTPFSVILRTEEITALDGADGRITAAVSNEENTYTYLWSTGATTAAITDLIVGTYSVTVTDEKGCAETQSAVLTGIDCSPFNIDFITVEPNCGATDGQITAMVTGDNGPYVYKWSTEQEGPEIIDLNLGTYTVTVTDTFGCFSVSDMLLVGADDVTPPTIECPEDRVTTNTCNIPVIYELVTTDACSMVELELIQGLASGVEFPQGETLVEYMAIDAAGNNASCTFRVTHTSDMSVTYDPTFLIENTGEQILFAFDLKCSDIDAVITDFLIVNGGMAPYTFSVETISNEDSTTNYLVDITDAAGCLFQDQVDFLNIDDTPDTSPILEVVIINTSTEADGSIELSVDDRFGMVSYIWTKDNVTVSTTQNLENVGAGIYSLDIIDQYGCIYSSDYQVRMITSTNELLLEKTVQIFPNPTRGNFQIQIDLPNPTAVTIDLYDVNGRLLQTTINKENTNTSIDISHYPKGIYLTKISAEDEVIVKRVVLL